jgi:hypothetical protein
LLGCSGAPSDVDHFGKSTELLDRYLNTNAVGAEAALLELEAWNRRCKQAGTRGVDFDAHFAAVYSRLYLVERELGKSDAAENYYQKAAESWRHEYATLRLRDPTPAEIKDQVESVDRHLQPPAWRDQK